MDGTAYIQIKLRNQSKLRNIMDCFIWQFDFILRNEISPNYQAVFSLKVFAKCLKFNISIFKEHLPFLE
jgi:hypothetical protein